MPAVKVIDKKGNTKEFDLEYIIKEFRSEKYNGIYDDTLKHIFVWMRYPITNPESQIGFVYADHIDEANYIISTLQMQEKIDIDCMCTLNVYRMYDWLVTNAALLKQKGGLNKIWIYTNKLPSGRIQHGIVVAKTMYGAKKILEKHGVEVSKDITYEEFDPKKTEYVRIS